MTLRLRLVLGILLVVTAGLAAFGSVTYTLYARSEYRRLDAQIRDSAPLVHAQLDSSAARTGSGPAVPSPTNPRPLPGDGRNRPPVFVAPGTYAELRSTTGAVVAHLQLASNSALPRLPQGLGPVSAAGRLFNVGSTSGSGGFRVLVTGAPDGTTTVIAVPRTEADDAVRRLLLIETLGAVALLVLLSAGSWLVLRRGLRPLEQMAGQARSITAGDLSDRVSPSGGASEVGQLGLALNTMLSDIEVAFAEREATEARLRRFLADASHELRTPLTSIRGFAELFRVSGDRAQVDLPTIMRRIEQEATRMTGLVEDLLLLASLDQSRPVDPVPVDLAVLAADAATDAAATAPDRAVTVDAPEPIVVLGHEAHLRQAIANLMTNALRHTPAGTPITIGTRLDDGAAALSVRDRGPGLDAEAAAHAFDRFWQADRARVGSGAGLGLAIVAGIAAEHGGTATVAAAEGGGAEFTIRLPLTGAAS